MPADTPIGKLVARHDAAKRELLGKQSKLWVVEIRTAADYDAMQYRQEAIKAAFRQGIRYLDPEEVRRIEHGVLYVRAHSASSGRWRPLQMGRRQRWLGVAGDRSWTIERRARHA